MAPRPGRTKSAQREKKAPDDDTKNLLVELFVEELPPKA
jgi:hypothetical protein